MVMMYTPRNVIHIQFTIKRVITIISRSPQPQRNVCNNITWHILKIFGKKYFIHYLTFIYLNVLPVHVFRI